MFDTDKKLDKYLFPVEERKVYLEDFKGYGYKPSNEHKAIVRGDNGKLISIQKNSYKLVKNSEVILPLMHELNNIDCKWYIDQTHSFVEDSKFRLQCTFPDLTFNDGRSDIALSLYLTNSYDSSESVKLTWGAIRFICGNGAIYGEILKKYARKHTQGFEVRNLKAELESTYEKIPVVKHRVEILQNTKPTQAFRNEIELKLGKNITKFIEEEEAKKKAISLWALYNLITYYVSHNLDKNLRAGYQQQTSKLFQL